jgi:prevent-host-death family protein
MIDVTRDIQSLTTFKRNTNGLLKRMRKTGRPLILTVKGRAEAVVIDAASYREVAGHLDTIASIRRGLAQAKKGMGRSVDDVFDDLDRETSSER